MTTPYDAILIGAGHNGLVCACYLAAAGQRVLVLERRGIVGGAAVTEEFHPGFRNSTASYTVGLLDPTIIEDLQLHEHGLEIVPRSMANFLPLADDRSLSIFNDLERDTHQFANFSAHDADALPAFRAMLRDVGDFVRNYLHETPPKFGYHPREWLKLLRLGRDFLKLNSIRRRNLVDLFTLPIADLLDLYFENTHVKAALAFDALVGNYASLHTPGTAYGLLHHALGEVASQYGAWGHPIGGMGAITQAMLRQAQKLGVHVETNAEVSKVLIQNGRVCGVLTRDGSIYDAKVVAANCAPKQLYCDLIDRDYLDSEQRRRIAVTRTESAVLRINVALSDLPQFTCKPSTSEAEHHRAGIVIGPSLEYMEQAYLDARQGRWSLAPVIEMVIPSTVDSTLVPPGKHVASLFCLYFPYAREWDKHRELAADSVFQTIDKFAPNFSSSVIARQILTPLDLKRRFHLPGGDIFHGAHIPSQIWVNRPLSGYASYKGMLRGLFHCGAGAHPGGGVSGIPGRNAAQEILRS